MHLKQGSDEPNLATHAASVNDSRMQGQSLTKGLITQLSSQGKTAKWIMTGLFIQLTSAL